MRSDRAVVNFDLINENFIMPIVECNGCKMKPECQKVEAHHQCEARVLKIPSLA